MTTTTHQHLTQIREMDRLAEENGFVVRKSKHHWEYQFFGLFPAGGDFTQEDNCLPIYSRDAELYSGTAEDLICYMRGWMRSREYLQSIMPKSVNESRIKKFEDTYRQEALVRLMKEEKK